MSEIPPIPRAWSVAAVLLAAADALQARLGAITVRGELSGFTRAGSGHCYFALKDDEGHAALLRCAMFRRCASLLDFAPGDGQLVEVRGRIAVYEARGELQCVVESMQRLGAGSLYELFLRLKARLEAAGLFARERKRAVLGHPARVGVVTSPGAAALHDVLTTLARRAPHVEVVVYPSAVQGADAPEQLVRAIGWAGERAEVDTLIVCRGGGSLEDLWAFNDERVVRAIAACPIPVVCGIGHETDVTLSDLAADLRAPTPTAAAELVTPVRDELAADLAQQARRLGAAMRRALDARAQRADLIALRLGRPAGALAAQAQRLAHLQQRCARALGHALELRRAALGGLARRLPSAAALPLRHARGRLDAVGPRLQALDPHQVLARGYTWLVDADGRPVTSAHRVAAGDRLAAHWADGSATVQVLDVALDPPG